MANIKSLPSKSVVRVTGCTNMTSAVYHGRKATNQTNKHILVNL